MSELPEIELSVGLYPFSKKICLVLRRGASCRILARFDSQECADLFLSLCPTYRPHNPNLKGEGMSLTERDAESDRLPDAPAAEVTVLVRGGWLYLEIETMGETGLILRRVRLANPAGRRLRDSLAAALTETQAP